MWYAFKHINKMFSTLSGIISTSKTPHKQACKQGARINSEWNDVHKN